MEYHTLGKTGLHVSALGFGGAGLGYDSVSQPDVDRLLDAALDAGLNALDTPPVSLLSLRGIRASQGSR